ncbi:Gryzun, putative trafficking through Golgi,Foie gras liver health family 1,Tetratricopeptide-like helical [Cinara cedri]|uniref:Gryzun, putative trafficking through Golgi,Foie gras liver health family 1,Tetratricopeptide-like helical n=1 Tax=Cinara cedri TaxID=506608 RepID=A0A5E4MH68_9HEMI|nr:Gryzun, putative trafficking through Golgi,Foie gras liver health family 1,Tetratricopeptide-like helical [Cinara cedri]
MADYREFDFPPELCCSPSPLIAVAGLDTVNNAVHRSIWDAFHSPVGRESRAVLNFFHLTSEYRFPATSEKRVMPYIPKGVLKKNWIEKHLRYDPAVVVIFYDCDWDDESWTEKISECSSRVQSIRLSLEGRKSRIVVVLIQKRMPIPTVDDAVTNVRAASLCEACTLNPKALFMLPVVDNIHGYAIRLENAFYDLAQNYYQQQIRAVKLKLENLSKTSHQYLIVRYTFKIGFYNELKQDHHNAHKHYHQCYMSLLEIRTFDTNIYEVKVIAAYIVYKISRLLFAMKRARDALTQFNSYINEFKLKTGPPELLFEHYGWLSKQFSMFASLFDDTTAESFTATQALNPGFFFKEAAEYAKKRKISAYEICQGVNVYPASNPLSEWNNIEFYGQRPWRLMKTLSNVDYDTVEADGIQALRYFENTKVDHSKSIINLLGNAMKQFKNYKCPRMRNLLAVQMADEYYNAKDYSKALTLWSHMLWDYRDEGWIAIAYELVNKCLKCAYLTASVQNYVELNLEALKYYQNSDLQKALNNIGAIIQRQIPEPDKELSDYEKNIATEMWQKCDAMKPKSILEVDMSVTNSTVDTKVVLKEVSCDGIEFDIFLKANFPVFVQFYKLTACVTCIDNSYDVEVCTNKNELVYGKSKTYKYTCKFVPSPNDVGKEITVNSIQLQLGNEPEFPIVLKFYCSTKKTKNFEREINNFSLSKTSDDEYDRLKQITSATLKPRSSKLGMEIKHDNPALLLEWYKVSVCLTNLENQPVSDVCLNLSLDRSNNEKVELTTEICEDTNSNLLSLPVDFKLDRMLVGEQKTQYFYIRSSSLETRCFQLMISYMMKDDNETMIACVKDVEIVIDVVVVFDISVTYMSSKFEPVTKVYMGEPLIVMPSIKCLSPWPIFIENTSFQLAEHVSVSSGGYQSVLNEVVLESDEVATEVICILPSELSENSLGRFTVNWKRSNLESKSNSGYSSLELPKLAIEKSTFLVDMKIPAHGWLHTPMSVVYLLHNNSESLLTLDVSMEANEAFMMAGHKDLNVTVLPESTYELHYNLYPLVVGVSTLPKMHISCTSEPNDFKNILNDMLVRSLQTQIYIMPKHVPTNIAADV